jgi:hypothetical protein
MKHHRYYFVIIVSVNVNFVMLNLINVTYHIDYQVSFIIDIIRMRHVTMKMSM